MGLIFLPKSWESPYNGSHQCSKESHQQNKKIKIFLYTEIKPFNPLHYLNLSSQQLTCRFTLLQYTYTSLLKETLPFFSLYCIALLYLLYNFYISLWHYFLSSDVFVWCVWVETTYPTLIIYFILHTSKKEVLHNIETQKNMRNALLQRQNLTLKAIQVHQGRRRPKSVGIPFYPIKDCSVLTLSYHQKYLFSQRVSPPFKKRRDVFSEVNATHPDALQSHNTENSKIPNKRNCAGSVPTLTFMCLLAIYIFQGSVCLFCCRKICGPILGIFKSVTDT